MAALESGLTDCLAVDGEWISAKDLLIPQDLFRRHDLERAFDAGRRYDLALSLEVAEHLHRAAADEFISSLTLHADVVMFGAALRFQGGTRHLNEQWPGYWIERFRDRGFTCFDVIRPLVWNNADVPFYYKQNTYIFVREVSTTAAIRETLQEVHHELYRRSGEFCFIHPDKWAEIASYDRVNFDIMMPKLPHLLGILLPRMVRRRLMGRVRALTSH